MAQAQLLAEIERGTIHGDPPGSAKHYFLKIPTFPLSLDYNAQQKGKHATMNKTRTILRASRPRTGMAAAFATIAAGAASAAVTVSNVTFTQDAASHDVTVTYDLDTSDGEPAFVSLDVLTNGVSVGATRVKSVIGDVSTTPADTASLVAPRTGRSITWKARADLPNVGLTDAAVRVTAIATNHFAGLFMVLDVSRGNDSAWYPVRYTACEPDLSCPATYASEIWLRRVPAGTFRMGYGTSGSTIQHSVTLTKDYYCGLFPVTVAQHRLLHSLHASVPDDAEHDRHPVTYVRYNELRGINWPNNNAVQSGQVVYKLRNKTGLSFDIPTEAQWEYACRSGHAGDAFYDGEPYVKGDYVRYGWGQLNAGGTTHPVGLLQANDWGFYDFYGNVHEFVRDYYAAFTAEAQTNPPGPTSEAAEKNSNGVYYRVRRGGGYGSNETGLNSYYRNKGAAQTSTLNNSGYRLVVETDEDAALWPVEGGGAGERGSADSPAGLLETRPAATLAGVRANSAYSIIDTATPLVFMLIVR